MLGYYIGDDLNGALDNLWFTLLFKRHDALSQSDLEFEDLFALFWNRMSCERGSPRGALSQIKRDQIFVTAETDRAQHPRDWLLERARSFVDTAIGRDEGQPWGWKEPNTHLIIDRIFARRNEVKYIHFVRHPIDMAFSNNQNQLLNWGRILLGCDVQRTPRFSLKYWCAVHRRMLDFARIWPDRILISDFDAIIASPNSYCDEVAAFLGVEVTSNMQDAFRNLVDPDAPSRGRFNVRSIGDFDDADIAYVRECGYRL